MRGFATSKLYINAKKMIEALGLNWAPIGAKFSAKSDETNKQRKVSICEAFNIVKHEGILLSITKETCVCPGGRHFTGLEILPIDVLAPAIASKTHRVYESAIVASVSIKKQPQPMKRGDYLMLGPLAKFKTDPDLVFFIVTPMQADKILGLVSFKGAEPFMYYPASSICSTITNVLAKARPEINLISTFERRGDKWSPNELIVALPLKDFKEAVENLADSGYVA